MNLTESLEKYNHYLYDSLKNHETLSRFKLLSNYDNLGCFCDPTSSCHVDIIRYYLYKLELNVPKRKCVKTKFIRKETKYENLEQWINDPKNMLCTRQGKIFIGNKKNCKVYHYPESEWCNPYRVENKNFKND